MTFRCNTDGIARIWAYIGNDDPTRGESHGAIGLAKQIATILNGRILIIDREMMRNSFQNTHETAQRIKDIATEHGAPDIVIGHAANDTLFTQTPLPTVFIPTSLPSMAHDLFWGTPLEGVVPHHLTLDILQQAEAAFHHQHPNLPRPLTAIFTTSLWQYSDQDDLFYDLARHGHLDGTIYFCPSRRTEADLYQTLTGRFKSIATYTGRTDRIHVIAPTFDSVENEYNPYVGLVAAADRAILLGESQSILSECITHGRTLYTDTPYPVAHTLLAQHYVRDLYRHDPGTPLIGTELPPLNVTGRIADHIAETFNAFAVKRARNPQSATMQNPFVRLPQP